MPMKDAFLSFFKEHTTALSKGRFWLDENSNITLGEPVKFHALTGLVATPIKKRRVQAYNNATPGAEEVIGVSLDIRYSQSGVSDDDKIMRPDWYYPREITIMQIGICPVLNTATGYAANVNDKALPAIGGAQAVGAPGISTGYTLGKWLQDTPAQEPGLIWVNPMMEVL